MHTCKYLDLPSLCFANMEYQILSSLLFIHMIHIAMISIHTEIFISEVYWPQAFAHLGS